MSSLPDVSEVLACALLGLVLWAACAGIGDRVLPARDAPQPDEPASWRQPGIAACVGLGVLVMLGGFAVLLHVPWWAVVAPFVVVGLALAVLRVRRLVFRPLPPRSVVVLGCCGVAALGLVALLETVAGFRFPLHAWDDLRAYLPLAHRLIDTNALVDPWNARRLQNLGGFTFLQAMPVAIFGNAGIGVVETMLASIFLGGLFVANGFRSTWARIVSVLFILAVPLLWVPRINTTGVLMGSPLLVASLAITVELRRALRAGHRVDAGRWAVAGGLLATALYSVRPTVGMVAVGVLTVGPLLATGSRVLDRARAILVAGASALVALVPWSLASWQTVGTPLFPLFTGNQNLEAIRLRGASSLGEFGDKVVGLLFAGPYLWMALAIVVVAFAARKALPDAPLIAIGAVVTVAVMAAIAVQGYGMGRIAYVRYIAPTGQGLALFFAIEAVRGADAWPERLAARGTRSVAALAALAAVGIAAIGYSGRGMSVEFATAPAGADLIARAITDDLGPKPPVELTTPALRRAYRQALAGVDPDRTIAAVDRPYLIDYRRFDIPDLDLPGFTAPGGKFPFFTGPAAKVARLRQAGYDTLLATVPSRDIALSLFLLRAARAEPRTPPYTHYMSYYLDWEDDLAAIAERAPGATRKFGPLLVIDLDRAQRELSARSPRG